MTEFRKENTHRSVTEQQVIDVLNKHGNANNLAYFEPVYKELFPELPNQEELILVWDREKNDNNHEDWLHFHRINEFGQVVTMCPSSGIIHTWDNFRRQTPAERGEG
jgi:hypothetical protein